MSVVGGDSDPLAKAGPPAAQVLLERMGRVVDEFPLPVVIDAATNLLVNAIRQSCGKRNNALAAWDELFGRGKSVLDAHYDSVTGNRRNVFPHTQHIVVDAVLRDAEGL